MSERRADPTPDTLEERLERLERSVEAIQRALEGNAGAVPAAPSRKPAVSPPAAPRATAAWRARLWDSEIWLNKLGVALVLFGVTFLFKYSIEQGWLTPGVRVAIGLVVGTALLAAGLRLPERQRALARVLAGGGIAVFYIVGFAAYQMYALVGYGTAFAGMAVVTAVAFMLSVREDDPVLSLIGVKGALGTPFLLYGSRGDFTWLVAYTCLVVVAAVALYLRTRWRSVLWTALLGGWAVLGVAWMTDVAGTAVTWTPDRILLQFAAILLWSMGAVVAVRAEWGWGGADDSPRTLPVREVAHRYGITTVSALAGVGSAAFASPIGSVAWGWLAMAAAVAYAGGGLRIVRRAPTYGAAHLLAAALILPMGGVAALAGEQLLVLLAVVGAVLHPLSRRYAIVGGSLVGHLLFGAVVAWTVVRLQSAGIAGSPRALADLATAALALAAATSLQSPAARSVYRLAVHTAILAWLWRELAPFTGGAAYVSVAWSVYAVALIAGGLRFRADALQRVGLATLVVVVAKLFVVDLAALDALWRIVLFLGIGGGFLLISYLLQGLWQARSPAIDR
jgi:uncharacterized membrane protein